MVYFWHATKGITLLNPDETYEDITCSAYYIGQLSSLDLYFLGFNSDMVNPYKGYNNEDEPWNVPEPTPMGGNRNTNNEELDERKNQNYVIDAYEIRQNNYVCILYNKLYTYGFFVIENNKIISQNNKRSNDINAIVISH